VIKSLLEERLDLSISSFQSIAGGDINDAARLNILGQATLFVKYNQYSSGGDMLSKEARGLQLLDTCSLFDIPQVHCCDSAQGYHFLVMDYIQPVEAKKDHWVIFGRRLAEMHRCSVESFGLDHENYIGSLTQSNRQHSDWMCFYIHERLLPQIILGHKSGIFSKDDVILFERLRQIMNNYLDRVRPALLHGDLWSANCIAAISGITLIDPAVYYGDREVDLAMMRLFGGFPTIAFEAYEEAFPLPAGHHERIALYQLYPILVHANLFGGQYIHQARRIMKSYL